MSLPVIESMAFKWSTAYFQLLDQTLLPRKELWLNIETTDQMIEAIQSLRVRGAPLIGVTACLFLAFRASQQDTLDRLLQDARALAEARPTAVNLANNINQLLEHFDSKDSIVAKALRIFEDDRKQCDAMALLGAELINDGDSILTHCNTGSLATAGLGTALGVVKEAHRQGKRLHVYVDETRPLLQGARLTCWELQKEKIPYTLITDSMAAFLMKQKKVSKVFVGCDRIAVNGDFANKIGTYSLGALCYLHKIPFYVVGPQTTVDPLCKNGDQIPIEERPSFEVTGFHTKYESLEWSPLNTRVYNPSFDVTPNEFVTAWVLNHKIVTRRDLGDLCWQ